MTSIATAGMIIGLTPRPALRAAGVAPSSNETRSFSDMLEAIPSPERAFQQAEAANGSVSRRVAVPPGEQGERQATGIDEELRETSLSASAVLGEPPLIAILQTAGQTLDVPYMVPSRGQSDASIWPAPAALPLSAAARTAASDLARSLQGHPAESSVLVAEPATPARVGEMGSVVGSAQTTLMAGGRVLSAARQETYLPAVELPGMTVGQLAWTGQHSEHGAGSTGDAVGRSALDTVPEVSLGSTAHDSEPIVGQIANQVVSNWSVLRDSLPAGSTEGAAPMTAASPTHEPPDVVKALRFELHPGELGEVQVRLSMNRNELRLHLSFSADRAASIAQADGQALIRALSDGGLILSQLVIDALPATRVEPQSRQDGAASYGAPSGGTMTDGGGAGREQHGHQAPARRASLNERMAAEPTKTSSEKSGIFI